MDWFIRTPEARAALTQRIVIVGSESTGKTTLARELVAHYRGIGGIWAETKWVAEYGREYTELLLDRQEARNAEPDAVVHSAEWTAPDFALIAIEQQQREDAAAASGSPVLLCDTDAFATQLWERRYLGAGSTAALDAVPVSAPRRLYLLADLVGVPFEQDGIRDGESYREEMQRWFVEELTERGEPWILITGTRTQRLAASIAAVDDVVSRRFPELT
ncbi:MAG: ATP-binding protein [Salinibacterium sp.]|nr:ATP-binding protein [Salinibacterium sp.]